MQSTGDDTPDDTENNDELSVVNGYNGPRQPVQPVDYDMEEHYTFLAAREQLQPFSGQVPPKKKKKRTEQTEADSPVAAKPKVSEIFFLHFAFLEQEKSLSPPVLALLELLSTQSLQISYLNL